MKITAAAWLLIIGLMVSASGVAYGLTSVEIGAGTSCGNAFQKSDSLDLTGAGDDQCAAARSDRSATTWALIVPGVLALLIGAVASAWSKPDGAPQTTRPPRPAEAERGGFLARAAGQAACNATIGAWVPPIDVIDERTSVVGITVAPVMSQPRPTMLPITLLLAMGPVTALVIM